jgi:hypothetical protein
MDFNLMFNPTNATVSEGMMYKAQTGSGADASWQTNTGGFRAISGMASATASSIFALYGVTFFGSSAVSLPTMDLNPTVSFLYGYALGNGSSGDRPCDINLSFGGSSTTINTSAKRFGIRGNRTTDSTSESMLVFNHNGTSETSTEVREYTQYTTYNMEYMERLTCVVTSGTDIKYYVNGTLRATHTTNLPAAAFTDTSTWFTGYARNNSSEAGAGIHVYVVNIEIDAF